MIGGKTIVRRSCATQLRKLRNDISVRAVIDDLYIATRQRGTRPTFLCPSCETYLTAINPRANLARCFRCQRNFNPIDLAMEECGYGFLQAVRYVEALLRAQG